MFNTVPCQRPLRAFFPHRLICCSNVAFCFALLALGGLCDLSNAHDEPYHRMPGFQEEPADALVRRLEPGLGFSVVSSGDHDDSFAQRCGAVYSSPHDVVATDPATGLVVRRQSRWIPELRSLVVDTTINNTGQQTAKINNMAMGDWVFRVRDDQDGTRYRELTYRDDTWHGSTYWTGPDWTRVGKDWHHSGDNTPSVRHFRAPRDGRVNITGRVYKADTNNGGGDGVRLFIRHGRQTVWEAEIEGNDDRGVEPNITFDVREGDAIRFAVHKRGQISYDTTHWDPVVTYADGESFQASAGFSTNQQGESNWFYEMEAEPLTEIGLPRIHGYGLNVDLRAATAAMGQPITLSDRDALPLIVLADGADKSGVAIALTESQQWRFDSRLLDDGKLHIQLSVADEQQPLTIEPGESLRLPRVALSAYRGSWLTGVKSLQAIISGEQVDGARGLREQVVTASQSSELDLWTMVQDDWRRQDKLVETVQSYADATQRQLENARRLLNELRSEHGTDFLAANGEELDSLVKRAGDSTLGLEDRRLIYLRVRSLKRQIALANPLMQFGPMLFCKRVPTSYSHQVMQYYGWRARPGGSLFVLDKPGHSLATRDILDGQLAHGSILEPRLSYDARRIVFSFVDCTKQDYDPNLLGNDVDEGFYHVYEMNVDGSGLRQITQGPYEDLMPTYLPDGGIAFCSSRRRGHSRCFGGQFSNRWQVYTLHRMDADGSNIRTLSYHDTNEWFPAVSNDGLLLYSRWDYIDRDAVTHQNLWSTRVDGTNPIAVWGNATASPHCTFQIQPIPNSQKVVFTASAHHSITAGSIAVVDPMRGDDGQQAITRITPEVPFPEAEGRNIQEYYAAPWPLSEKYFLAAYSHQPLVWEPGANESNALGIYLIDAFGNRELLYRDPEIGSTNPCPLMVRPAPPVVTGNLPEDAPSTGVMTVLDVYQGLGEVARGTIKELRIVQIFPKTTHLADQPLVGLAGEENARAILGTVPVESDGSAHFVVPARKPILFQALDKDGFAYQTMRSLTYVQRGEHTSCIGCHESRLTSPDRIDALATHRPPSHIDPGELGGRPFSFVEVVQPVLDRHCITCHGAEQPDGGIDLTHTPHNGFTKSYWSLCDDRSFTGSGTNPANAAEALVPRFGARNQIETTPPGGAYGALGSRLIKLLRNGHHEGQLSSEELRRLAAWIDCNAIFYGVYSPEDQARQLRGEKLAMPEVQ